MERQSKAGSGAAFARLALLTATAAAIALVSPLATARADTSPSPSDSLSSSSVVTSPSPTGSSTPSPDPTPSTDPMTPSPSTPAPAPTSAGPSSASPAPTSTGVPVVPVPTASGNQLPRLKAAGGTVSATSPHGPYDMTTDACAVCHRAHTAKSEVLLKTPGAESTLCLTCHDGTGSNLNVLAQYTVLNGAVNDATTGSYYYHDVSAQSSHVLGADDEFRGQLNRHAECGDCHDPHSGTATGSTSSPVAGASPATDTPWSLSGRTAGASGVSVTNGGNGSAPIYTFLNGNSSPVVFEFQLCLKCHSGYTTLLTKDPLHPSRDMLDAGAEFNPANFSFHPVEAAGRNTTPAMALSLSGPSAYKLWSLTPASTVRCTNCHASPLQVGQGAAQGADAAVHASPNRGILAATYEDRVLTDANDGFIESNFALCFLCHTDTPFTGSSLSATNFNLHNKHVAGISGNGNGGRDIDVAGAGQGNALCAECHFRPHSTATTTNQWSHLVAFSPNVQPINGVISWRSTGVGSGSCTLRCHGQDHVDETYSN
ncbi:MAG TPA: cytochrome c3 family protein [Candidatus Nanopelagicales bacterium]|nr:cytochrome c3 family protein [Candidatus Nanopelagicales bacterium]